MSINHLAVHLKARERTPFEVLGGNPKKVECYSTVRPLFVSSIVLFATVMAFAGGGIRAPGMTIYIVMALTAGLLLGERAGVVTALMCSGLGLCLAVLEEFGILPSPILYSGLSLWLLLCLYHGMVVVLMRLATQSVTRALRRAQTELSERRNVEKRCERAEKELQDNQLLLQTMIENTPAAVAMLDTEMRYIAYSRRWLSDYRLGGRDLKGLSHYAVFPESAKTGKKCIAAVWRAPRQSSMKTRFHAAMAQRTLSDGWYSPGGTGATKSAG